MIDMYPKHYIIEEGYRVCSGNVGGYAIDCRCGERLFGPVKEVAMADFRVHMAHATERMKNGAPS